jgi:hypothetical protein
MIQHIKAEAESSDGQDTDSDAAVTHPPSIPSKTFVGGEKAKEKSGKPPRREHSLLSSHWEMELDQSAEEAEGDRAPPETSAFTLGGRSKKTRKRMTARRKSQTKREADKAERYRWEKVLRYMNIGDGAGKGIPRGYLSYRCKVYLVSPGRRDMGKTVLIESFFLSS